ANLVKSMAVAGTQSMCGMTNSSKKGDISVTVGTKAKDYNPKFITKRMAVESDSKKFRNLSSK
uniref:hypothetical protein n=1 Tax=Salmonella sp. s57402 TaxID=3159695 RepID=UPI003980AA06